MISIDTEFVRIGIDIAEPLITLARHLRKAETHDAATEVLQEADTQLDVWERSHRTAGSDVGKVALPFGLELHMPRDFEFRR